MKNAFPIVPRAHYFPRHGIAVGVRGAVHSIDVNEDEAPCAYLSEQHAAFEIPFHGLDDGVGDVAADESADAVYFPAEARGVVFVAGEAEVGVVEGAVGVGSIGWVQGGVDGALEGGLGWCVCGGDFDFLEAEDLGVLPSLEGGAEGRGWWWGFGGSGGLFEEGGYWGGGGGEEGVDAVDVPGVDAEGGLGGGGGCGWCVDGWWRGGRLLGWGVGDTAAFERRGTDGAVWRRHRLVKVGR